MALEQGLYHILEIDRYGVTVCGIWMSMVLIHVAEFLDIVPI